MTYGHENHLRTQDSESNQILLKKNGSDEGWFEVVTGKYSSADFGRIVKYNDDKKMSKWRGESCNAINGTDGIIFPPFMKYEPNKRIYVVVPGTRFLN